MKKKMCRILVCLLVFLTCAPISLNAKAAEIGNAPLYLENYSGDILTVNSQKSGLPFTVAPQNISDLYTTNRDDNGYNFVPGRVSGTIITVNGTLRHSLAAGLCKGGVCHSSGGTYVSDIAGTAISEQLITASLSKATLNRDGTYYGFAKNMAGEGVISSGYVIINAQ